MKDVLYALYGYPINGKKLTYTIEGIPEAKEERCEVDYSIAMHE